MSELMGSGLSQRQQQAPPPQSTRGNTACGCIVMLAVLVVVMGGLARACNSCNSGDGKKSTTQDAPVGGVYTMDQYARLSIGMSFDEVDSIMGGGAIKVADDGRFTMWAYTNVDAVGSQITVSFDGDILVDFGEEGL